MVARMAGDPLQILKSTFGYQAFRGHQAAAIEHIMAGGDALILMPTGGGKSLIYQIPALARDGAGVIVSPLIALMQNQVDRLRELGVRAAFLNSTLLPREAADVERRLLRGELDMLYVAPERLVMPGTVELLKRAKLSLFAIDEAHCISQWGHDFRKDYLQLAMLRREFPEVPVVALTATADERTRHEIVARLMLRRAEIFVSSFDRPNIQYRITEKRDTKSQLLAFLEDEHPDDAGIVYCMTRASVETTAAWLAGKGRKALPYHAGMSAEARQKTLTRFLREDDLIVVATIAFGMGIDKPDVRFVAHLDLPKSLEAYYQETGRAGRDGEPATAWLAYGIQDVIALRQMADKSDADESYKRIERQKIQSLLGFCEITSCRRQALLRYFGETLAQPCGNCDICLHPVEAWDATVEGQKALSTVFRTGQRFGVGYLLDVLLGKDNERIKRFHHDELSVFGVGKDCDEAVWRSVFRQIIAQGLVQVDDHGSLRLTETATPILRGQERLLLRKELREPRERKKKKRGGAARGSASAAVALSEDQSELYAALAQYRQKMAQEAALPAYCIFHNSTLQELARIQPLTTSEMRGVPGIGDTKLAKYGEGFLRIIRAFRNGA
jgi:ATP-dependent DNA helicase RecQ